MKDTIIVNFFAGPGCGKSTGASWLFSQLKINGVDCEYVTEFAKDKVWENNGEVFKCEFYITGKQSFKISRCFGKVDVIITDSPIAISMAYSESDKFKAAVLEEFNKYEKNNLNILLRRVVPYDPNGRIQKDEGEAKQIDETIQGVLDGNNIPYTIINGNTDGYQVIVDMVLEELERRRKNK
jgi:nicotinamide riboside kinase